MYNHYFKTIWLQIGFENYWQVNEGSQYLFTVTVWKTSVTWKPNLVHIGGGGSEPELETWSEVIVSWLLSHYVASDWSWEMIFSSPVSCHPSCRQAAEHDNDEYCCSCKSLVWASPIKDYFCWLLWALGGPGVCSFNKSCFFWQANLMFCSKFLLDVITACLVSISSTVNASTTPWSHQKSSLPVVAK